MYGAVGKATRALGDTATAAVIVAYVYRGVVQYEPAILPFHRRSTRRASHRRIRRSQQGKYGSPTP
jgi:hypothetical protein